jgi:hypothetical protein
VAALLVLLPRWRRRGVALSTESRSHPALSIEDAARLDADMARFD